VGDIGLVWVEIVVSQGSGRRPLKGSVPLAITEYFELAEEVSPHLGRLWWDGRRAEVAGFLKVGHIFLAVNVLGNSPSVCKSEIVPANELRSATDIVT
jgi:hypothetical protein